MKRIINGKKYDTETAKKIASYHNNCSVTDFNYFYECLYLKKTGEFFICGEGGALTKYVRSDGSGAWCYGEKITPLSLEEAKRWVERYANDQYEEIFGPVEE